MTVKLLRVLLLTPIMLAAAGCGTVDTIQDWLTEDVYEAPPAELIEFTQEIEPQVIWSADTGEGGSNEYTDLNIWIEGDRLFTVDHEGEVHCYQAQTGKSLWQTELDVDASTGAGGGEGLVLIGTREGEIIALSESDGKVKWRRNLSSEVLAPAKAAAGVVVTRTSDGRVSGLSASDGEILWNYQRVVPLLSLRGAATPMIAQNKVIAGYDNGKLVALSLADGKVLWEKSVAVPKGRTELDRLVDIDADPVIKSDVVYAVAFHGNVAALSLETGQVYWSREMSSQTGLDAIAGEAVFISDDDSYLWAVQDGSGDSLWRQTRLLRRKITAPAIVGSALVVGDFEGYLHWLATNDGHFVARQKLADAAIRSKPIVSQGILYVMASNGRLTAIRIP